MLTMLESRHREQAVELAQAAYEAERAQVPSLPDLDLRPAVEARLEAMQGVVLEEGGRLAGYLAFRPVERYFGLDKGLYSPHDGQAVLPPGRDKRLTRLFQAVAGAAAPQGYWSYGATVYAHDAQAVETWALNGFGIRCADAIRSLREPINARPAPGYRYEEISYEDALELLPLQNALCAHLTASPCFLPQQPFTPEAFQAHLAARRNRFFVLREGVAAAGYLEIAPTGETLASQAPDMRSICGAFVSEGHRASGLFDGLLSYVCQTLRHEGYERLGVDCETLNPTALRYWRKHFDLYTLSFHRRLDERVWKQRQG